MSNINIKINININISINNNINIYIESTTTSGKREAYTFAEKGRPRHGKREWTGEPDLGDLGALCSYCSVIGFDV